MLFIIFIAIVAFAAGVWYMGGFEPAPQEAPDEHIFEPVIPAPQAVYHNADANLIQVMTPVPGAVVGPVFTVAGQARGGWYFEASFPYEVLDNNNTKLTEGPVQAQGDWMTPEFVPFTFQISVPNYTGPATLILHNDNPSGLPENAASVSIPITIQ